MPKKYDFEGWATKNDLKCSDGRTIRRDAFVENDGETVPLVWHHGHSDPENVLGHALLQNREEGVWASCTFNNTPKAKTAKELVRHGDITSLSIYANNLVQQAGDVIHGKIREVSLVIAGANPGATIEFPIIEHSDGTFADPDEIDEAVIKSRIPFSIEEDDEMAHADDEKKPEAEEKSEGEGKTVQDIVDSMNEDQKKVLHYLVGKALEEGNSDEDSNDKEEDSEVKHNVFENDTPETALSHEDLAKIFSDAKRIGSLKEAVLQHSEDGVLAHADGIMPENYVPGTAPTGTYGVDRLDYLFPEARELNGTPKFIDRRQEWVRVIMNGVHHTPFSRVKTTFADITMDEARAKGYMKGRLKKEEVFSLLKRSTDPQTVYKKQKLDRDDIVDIVDFDVVAWIKGEMRMKLDEELAAAYVFGDGRLSSDDDKISPDHIRPIFSDAELFTIPVEVTAGNTADETAKNFIRAAIKARKDYRGGGNTVMFTSEDLLSDMLLLEDGIQHALYPDEAALARKLRVNRIVSVPDDILARAGDDAMALIVDLNDYNVGADKGGAVNMFDDFDIDYNQQKYLIETRVSGALTVPFSALAFREHSGT